MTLTKVWYQGRWQQTLTPRFLMALLSSWTTSIPSTPLTLKRLVHVIRKPWRQPKKARGKSKRFKSLLSVYFLGWVCKLWGLVTGKEWREVCWLLSLPHPVWSAGRGRRRWNQLEVSCLWCCVFPWSYQDTLPHGQTAGMEVERGGSYLMWRSE